MQTVTTIFFDIAKSVFRSMELMPLVQVVVRRQLKRRHVLAFFEKLPPCLVPGGACTHWKAPPLHGAHPERTCRAPLRKMASACRPSGPPASDRIVRVATGSIRCLNVNADVRDGAPKLAPAARRGPPPGSVPSSLCPHDPGCGNEKRTRLRCFGGNA